MHRVCVLYELLFVMKWFTVCIYMGGIELFVILVFGVVKFGA
jgi:hypothetical protein